MIFLAFVSTSCMVIMASTIACRCWLDSDPERQAMLMVLTGSPYGSPTVNERCFYVGFARFCLVVLGETDLRPLVLLTRECQRK